MATTAMPPNGAMSQTSDLLHNDFSPGASPFASPPPAGRKYFSRDVDVKKKQQRQTKKDSQPQPRANVVLDNDVFRAAMNDATSAPGDGSLSPTGVNSVLSMVHAVSESIPPLEPGGDQTLGAPDTFISSASKHSDVKECGLQRRHCRHETSPSASVFVAASGVADDEIRAAALPVRNKYFPRVKKLNDAATPVVRTRDARATPSTNSNIDGQDVLPPRGGSSTSSRSPAPTPTGHHRRSNSQGNPSPSQLLPPKTPPPPPSHRRHRRAESSPTSVLNIGEHKVWLGPSQQQINFDQASASEPASPSSSSSKYFPRADEPSTTKELCLPPKAPRRPTHCRHLSVDTGTKKQHRRSGSIPLASVFRSEKDEIDELNDLLAARRAKHGYDHPKVALTWNMIGNFHFKRGNLGIAQESYAEALRCYKASLGTEEHAHVASTLINIGTVQWRLGDYDSARESMERACRILEKTVGKDDPATGNALHNLGQVLCLRGDRAEATRVLTEALRIRRLNLGNRHVDVARTLSLMASVQLQIGKVEDALRLHQEALDTKKEVLGPRHPSVVVSMMDIAYAQQKNGSFRDAISMYAEALAMQKQRCYSASDGGIGGSPQDFKDVGVTLHTMGNVYARMGQVTKAKKFLNEACLFYIDAGLSKDDRCMTSLQRSIADVNNFILEEEEED